MVLVTGPTGSGKTTTLYGALAEITSSEDKIVTIEDPVEYQLKGITQIPINERKGLTFARGLRSILRHDPDKIMVGEIRDPETAQIAIQSALTGHLVFTTVHANNVIDVLGRFLNMGVEPYQFVSVAQLRARAAPGPHRLPGVPASGDDSRRPSCGKRKSTRAVAAVAHLLRRRRLHRMRRDRLSGPDRDLRAARPERPHPRADPRAGVPRRRSSRRRATPGCASSASRRSSRCCRGGQPCTKSTRSPSLPSRLLRVAVHDARSGGGGVDRSGVT